MTPWPEFFRDLAALFKAMIVAGDYIAPELLRQFKKLSLAPIFDDDRAAQVISKYEDEIEQLLDTDVDVTPYSSDIRALLVECLQELRGETIQKHPAIRQNATYQKITINRKSRAGRTKIPV